MGEVSVSVVRCYHQAQRSLAKPPIRPDRALKPLGQTNTSPNRPRTQELQQSQQPQRSQQPQQNQQPQRSLRPRTNQPEDMEGDYINEDFRISNNIVSHVIGREGRNIKFITSQHNTKAHYESNTEMMTIT